MPTLGVHNHLIMYHSRNFNRCLSLRKGHVRGFELKFANFSLNARLKRQ